MTAVERSAAEDAPSALVVAVGVLIQADGAVLITRRPSHAAHGGLWEFPGGKLEAGETVAAALRRELREELGIKVQEAEPVLQVQHAYPGQTVVLQVWRVHTWDGVPQGQEGQPLAWVQPERLSDFTFPAADTPIITWLRQASDLVQSAQQASPKSISIVL